MSLERTPERGFTLVEILVVVVIIGILASMAIPSYTHYLKNVRTSEAVTAIGSIRDHQLAYSDGEFLGDGKFANNLEDLDWTITGNSTGKYWTYTTDDRHIEAVAVDTDLVHHSKIRYHLHYHNEGRDDFIEFKQ